MSLYTVLNFSYLPSSLSYFSSYSPTQVPLDDPTPATRVELHVVGQDDITPPAYSTAQIDVALPTYAESERTKGAHVPVIGVITRPLEHSASATRLGEGLTVNGIVLGDDLGFLAAFLISLFFNWVGYLIMFCFARSIAARAGATAGFGLCFVKMGAIFKYLHDSGDYDDFFSRYGDRIPPYHEWAVWVAIVFGSLLFLRGVFSYSRAKRMARREHGF